MTNAEATVEEHKNLLYAFLSWLELKPMSRHIYDNLNEDDKNELVDDFLKSEVVE